MTDDRLRQPDTQARLDAMTEGQLAVKPVETDGIEAGDAEERTELTPIRISHHRVGRLFKSRTMAVVWILAVVLVALPVSYENLTLVFGPIIAQVVISSVGWIMAQQALFAVGGLAVVALFAAAAWLYERHPALLVPAGLLLVIALLMLSS